MKKTVFGLILAALCLNGFGQAKTYDFPNPVDTKTRPIQAQEKGVFEITERIFADNDFKSARLNSIQELPDGTIEAFVAPENEPINMSPWYAFRLWSINSSGEKTIRIGYPEGFKHRYWPKLSGDGENWMEADSSKVTVAADTSFVEIMIEIPSDTIWIAAQPIMHSGHVIDWSKNLATSDLVKYKKAGKSTGKRILPHFMISNGSPKNKDIIVCLSRQHPPEVTGYLALQGFIERIVDGSQLSRDFLDKYTVLVYPIMNPDGVDEGHWRHNLGGIDLNRDWAYYHQTETRTVANHIVKSVKKLKGRVALGLDFHSTWYDVYYTTKRDMDVINADFTDPWLEYIKERIPDYEPHDAPSGLGSPVSKGWFVSQFNANGITYEIGDNTPPDFINEKAGISAEAMMKVLLKRE